MSKVGKWSTTPGSNNATPPDGWPENQAPSTVNDCAREMMASVKTLVNDVQFIDYDVTPSFLTSTTFSLGTVDSRFEVGRRLKLFDASTLYGTIDSVSATFVSVRLDSGALTASLSSMALSVLSNSNNALPEMARRVPNVIINGDMEVWQRGVFFGGIANFQYTADRFMYEGVNDAGCTVLRKERSASSTMVPTLAQAGRYFNSSLQVACTAIDAVIGSTQYAMLSYIVEGNDWRPIAHKPMGLSFWVNSNKSGIYAVAMRSSFVSAACVQCYTISAVNVWQRVFMSFPEAPATPYSWDYSSGAGLRISWVLAAGASQKVTNLGAWTAGNLIAGPTQVNLLDTTLNLWNITGVELHTGGVDTPVVTPTFSQQMTSCQRYYWNGLPCTQLNGAPFANGAVFSFPIAFPSTMRATPSCVASLSGSTYNAIDSTQTTVGAATTNGMRFYMVANAIGTNAYITFGASDYLAADAEL